MRDSIVPSRWKRVKSLILAILNLSATCPTDKPLCNMAWLIHVCDVTHSNVWHDLFICVTRLIHVCAMKHLHVWHDPSMRESWLELSYSPPTNLLPDPFVENKKQDANMWMNHVTYDWGFSNPNESCHIWMGRVPYEHVMPPICDNTKTGCEYMTQVAYSHMAWPIHMWHDAQGAVGASVRIYDSTVCFVSAHLAAHDGEVAERNAQVGDVTCFVVWHDTYEWVTSHVNESCHT